jgi:hypothetical protein
MATREGERLLPVAVPSWLPPPDLPVELPQRLAFLASRALPWTVGEQGTQGGAAECRVFVRFSSQHWIERPASAARLDRWRGLGGGAQRPWRQLFFSAGSLLDDDDGDGDPLDDGELRAAGPGAEAEVFCGVSPAPLEPARCWSWASPRAGGGGRCAASRSTSGPCCWSWGAPAGWAWSSAWRPLRSSPWASAWGSTTAFISASTPGRRRRPTSSGGWWPTCWW